jgi:hypothetical protein
VYRTKQNACEHVQTVHYLNKIPLSKEQEDLWLQSFENFCSDQRLELYTKFISLSLNHLQPILDRAMEIRNGVASGGDDQKAKYLLPTSLVKALESTIMLLLYTPRSLKIVNEYCNHYDMSTHVKRKDSKYRLALDGIEAELDKAGKTAIRDIQRAQYDIMLMARTEHGRQIVRYDDVGPEYILATMMANLSSRILVEDRTIVGIYESFFKSLVSRSTYLWKSLRITSMCSTQKS